MGQRAPGAEACDAFDNGSDLAMSIERTTIYADPTLVTDPVAAFYIVESRGRHRKRPGDPLTRGPKEKVQ